MRLMRFFGGLTLPANKARSAGQPLIVMPVSERLILALAPGAVPCVNAGQTVRQGECIAHDGSGPGADLHAPCSGHIERMTPHELVLCSDGQARWQERRARRDWQSLDKATLLRIISRAGLVGLGGAGFPTATKLATAQPIHTLIINGAECEPYISCDDALMRERAAEIIEGAQILKHLLAAEHILIAVEDDKPEALAALNAANGANDAKAGIVAIPSRYPSGGQKQLITLLSGKEVPSGAHPPVLGYLVQNVATVAALARAVCADEPLIRRIVTVSGEGVARPGNYEVAIGTPIAELLRFAGVDDPARVLLGGPLTGQELMDVQRPITKTSHCLIVPGPQELPNDAQEQPCIRCGDCVPVCPAKLLPQQLFWFARSGELDKAKAHYLDDCIECGACTAVCPSAIPLVSYYQSAKAALRTREQEQRSADHARARFEARHARLARQAALRAAKKEARPLPVLASAPAQATPTETAPPASRALATRQAEIAEAQARAKAKRAGAGAPPRVDVAPPTATPVTDGDARKTEIAAALARAKAKRAGTSPSSPAIPAPPAVASDPRKAEIAAARARAAARKAQAGKEPPAR